MALKERLVFGTALDDGTLQRLDEIGRADIVVGIPSYRNARTIGEVARASSEGLALHYPHLRTVLVSADGGSSDDSVDIVAGTSVGPGVAVLTMLYNGLLGKGSGVRAIFEIANCLEARVCVILEAKAEGITTDWVRRLAQPVLDGEYDLVMPVYHRHPRAAAPNDLLAYPMSWALYGLSVRQPAGGDFGVSGALASAFAARDVWETDVARFGVDVWLTTLAINEGCRLCQVDLGIKTGDLKDPALPMDPRFLQMVGTLFRMANIYRSVWSRVTNWDAAVPRYGPESDVDLVSLSAPVPALWQAAQAGYARLGRIWRTVLTEEDFAAVLEMLNKSEADVDFGDDLWARVVYDFTVVYNKGEGDPDKVAQALLPLFYLRTLSHMLEAQAMTARERESLVQTQAKAFIRHLTYLWEQWVAYVPWLDEGTRLS